MKMPAQKVLASAVERALAPEVLLLYQQTWHTIVNPVKVWEKSRRIGASWVDASESVLLASKKSGADALYIGYSEDMTREYIDDCAMWAKAYSLAASEVSEILFDDEDEDGEKRHIKAFRIDFASGFKVLALSSRPRSIRGKQGKVTIDEAAFHDDLAGLIKAAMAMLIWGGSVAIISSHNGDENPFNELIKDIRAGKLPYALHRTTFRDAIADGLYQRICLKQGIAWSRAGEKKWVEEIYAKYGDNASEELDCVPRMSAGVYLPRVLVERCQDKTIPRLVFKQKAEFVLDDDRLAVTQRWIDDVLKPAIDAMPTNLRSVFGMDFGRDGDLSAMDIAQQHAPALWITAFAVELRRIPFDCQQLITFFILDNLPLFHHGKFDARGNGQSHAEAALQRYGAARVDCVMATQQWYADNMPHYKAALEGKTRILPAGEDVIADHRRAVLEKGKPRIDDGRDKGSDGEYRHGDYLVACLMSDAASRLEGEPAAGTSIAPDLDAFRSSRSGRRGGAVGVFRRRP
jgi:phage FluMu gp28-like protein